MCGIAGAIDLDTDVDPTSVERQLQCLDHRGPDSSGVYDRQHAAIGQTRLAVIDLVTGDPPITDEDGSIGVVLNGEIYNYRDLRTRLAATHQLATRCDTEVIAHLAEDLEPCEMVQRLEGMFALAAWDDRRQRLVLARDRMGKKPLYYWTDGRRFVFGSEIKAVVAHPLVPRSLDPAAIPAFLTFGYVPTPRTFFEGIASVPPGHVLTFDREGVSLARYWEPRVPRDSADVVDLPFDAAAREVRRLLTEAVQRRLIADVPLGAFLSGGVDSSAVVGIMAELMSQPVRTFTIGFEDDEGFDERAYARAVADRFNTDHVEFVVKPDAVDLVERIVWHHDQPFGDSSAVPTYVLSELTRQHVTVALCGDGGDELFGGYERFAGALLLERYRRLPPAARKMISAGLSAVPAQVAGGRGGSARRWLRQADAEPQDALLNWVSFVPIDQRKALVTDGWEWAVDDYHQKWDASAGADLLDRLLDVNIRTYLLDDLLPKVDRMAMANALEVRSPFLDHHLVDFALRLPRGARIRGWSTKRVLKEAMRDVLPREILSRRKRGFGVPLDRWFRSDLRCFVNARLGTPDARVRTYMNGAAVDRILSEHTSGTADHGAALWTLLTLEIFLRREGW